MQWNTLSGEPPRVIAHRGASGHRPEHSFEAHALAIAMGADIIEPDLVITRDGVLVVRHDRGLARSTDIASHPQFADRARKMPDGSVDWLIDDFVWTELGALRARQPFPGRSLEYDGKFPIIRFEDLLTLAERESLSRDRIIGIYPELKHPSAFAEAGLDITARFIDLVRARPQAARPVPIWLQCFELEPLLRVHAELGLRVHALFDTETSLRLKLFEPGAPQLPQVVAGIGIEKTALLDATGRSTGLLEAAHADGRTVHVWTLRSDRVPAHFQSAEQELQAYLQLGVDAIFADFPDHALAARARARCEPGQPTKR